MAARARRSAHFTVIDTIAQRHHLCCRPRRWSKAGIGVRALRWFGIGSDDRAGGSRWARARCGPGAATCRATQINHSINPPRDVVRNVERSIGSDRKPAGTMLRLLRSLDRSRETVGKYLARTRRAIAVQRLKHDVVATLGIRCSIPGTVEGDEHAAAVTRRKLLVVIEHCAVRTPMRWESCNRSNLVGAHAHFLAPVSAVFRGQQQLALHWVVVALRPSVIAALLQQHQFF